MYYLQYLSVSLSVTEYTCVSYVYHRLSVAFLWQITCTLYRLRSALFHETVLRYIYWSARALIQSPLPPPLFSSSFSSSFFSPILLHFYSSPFKLKYATRLPWDPAGRFLIESRKYTLLKSRKRARTPFLHPTLIRFFPSFPSFLHFTLFTFIFRLSLFSSFIFFFVLLLLSSCTVRFFFHASLRLLPLNYTYTDTYTHSMFESETSSAASWKKSRTMHDGWMSKTGPSSL